MRVRMSAAPRVSACVRRLRSTRATTDPAVKRGGPVVRAVRAERRSERGRSWPNRGDAERCVGARGAGRARVVCVRRAATKERGRATQSRARTWRHVLRDRHQGLRSGKTRAERARTRERTVAAAQSDGAGMRARPGRYVTKRTVKGRITFVTFAEVKFRLMHVRGGASRRFAVGVLSSRVRVWVVGSVNVRWRTNARGNVQKRFGVGWGSRLSCG